MSTNCEPFLSAFRHGAEDTPELEILEQIGREICAPVWCDFVSWVLDSARARGVTRLYFLSRDAQIFLAAARHLPAAQGFDLRYLYVSRQAVESAAAETADEALALIRRDIYTGLSFEGILQRLGLSHSDCGLEGAMAIPPAGTLGRRPAEHLLSTLGQPRSRQAIAGALTARRRAFLSYLKQEGLADGTSFALVDIGWKGSIQASLQKLLATAAASHGLCGGFYFGFLGEPDHSRRDFRAGYVNEVAPSFLRRLPRGGGQVYIRPLEALCSADHAQVIGYVQEQAGWSPVLGGCVPAPGDLNRIQRLQAGVIAGVLRWQEGQPGSLLRLEKLCRRPAAREADALGSMPYSIELLESRRSVLAPRFSVQEARRMAGRFAQVGRIGWFPGVLRRSPVLAALLLWLSWRAERFVFGSWQARWRIRCWLVERIPVHWRRHLRTGARLHSHP